MSRWLLYLLLPVLSIGCSSIVAPGQSREDLDGSGATRWALTEYDFGGSHFVWIPHWTEGLLHLSSPKAANAKRLDVLEFRGGALVAVEELGENRDLWAGRLASHGRFKKTADALEADPLYIAAALKIIHLGAPLEAVLFGAGFPRYGPNSNPHCLRPRSEIKDDDVLYYFVSRGGAAQEIVLRGGKVSEIREAQHLDKGWIPFYHPIVLP